MKKQHNVKKAPTRGKPKETITYRFAFYEFLVKVFLCVSIGGLNRLDLFLVVVMGGAIGAGCCACVVG